MSSFEWMELQTLTHDIAATRSRLAAARSDKDQRLIRMLEEELGAAEARRDRLLSHITNDLAGDSEHRRPAVATEQVDADDSVDADEASLQEAPAEQQEVRPAAEPGADEPDLPADASTSGGEGGRIEWDRLTPGDIDRAKTGLAARRAAILARHAEVLQQLDADDREIEALDQAIEAFADKFRVVAPGAAIVQLDEERELRLQGRG
jgi:hypothetical protein